MPHVLGLDSSTQSLSAVILDTDSGTIVSEDSVNFGKDLPQYGQPNGYDPSGSDGEVHAHPLMWLEALDLLLGRMRARGGDFSSIVAVGGSGQQHGSVYLKGRFAEKLGALSSESDLVSQLKGCLTRESAPIWMDSSTGQECREIAEAVGGDKVVCAKSGSIAIERFTGPQIRKFSKQDAYEETGRIHLVSSFFSSVMAGQDSPIDYGDGAGMNLMNLAEKSWDDDLLNATAPGLRSKLPELAPTGQKVGTVANYFVEKYGFSSDCQAVVWSGDNPCSLVGMGASRPGRLVISLGTSDTLFAAMPEPRTDPQGFGHVFGNPMGGFMSLMAFKNGSLAREAVKDEFDLEWSDFEVEALAKTPSGNDGLMMLPFFEPEITPRVNTKGPVYSDERDRSAEESVRAVLEGQFLNMRHHSGWLGLDPDRIYITGGASASSGIAQAIANVFGAPVDRLDVPGSAAIGAAMQAACAVGCDLEKLESHFSQPKPGGSIEPVAEDVAIYQKMAEPFADFLKQTLSS